MLNIEYCVHPFAWTGRWDDSCLDLIGRARRLGFDMIEIPMLELEYVSPKLIGKRAQEEGLGLCASTACAMEHDATSDDPKVRLAAVNFLKQCVEMTAEMGAKVFCGVTYSAIGRKLDRMPDQRHWDWAADALKQTAIHARKFDVTVGIEAINRYETFLINTCDQALDLCAMVDEPNVGVHLDAYHMNIEENDFYAPTLKAAPKLCHYHLSESHRGTPGTGRVDWEGIYRALNDADFSGSLGMESFIEIVPAMQAASCIWRKMGESSDQMLADGLRFLKNLQQDVVGQPLSSSI